MTSTTPVPGYRPQTERNIELVTVNKKLEEALLRALDGYAQCPDIDPRWLAIGRSHIEQGFMAVNRAIFQPERVKL